jgi:hypothetical protein
MATVNVFDVSISNGILDLSSGTGIYNVDTEDGDPTDEITQVVGHAHPHGYELRVAVAGHYWTIAPNPGNIVLQQNFAFATQTPDDSILLRASDKGSYVFEYWRVRVPSA